MIGLPRKRVGAVAALVVIALTACSRPGDDAASPSSAPVPSPAAASPPTAVPWQPTLVPSDDPLEAAGRRAVVEAWAAPSAIVPALNGVLIDALAESVPGIAAHREEIARGEREAATAVIEAFRVKFPSPLEGDEAPGAVPGARAGSHEREDRSAAGPHDWLLQPFESALNALVSPAQARDLNWSSLQSAATGSIFGMLAGAIGGNRDVVPGKELFRSDYAGKSGHDASMVATGEAGNAVTLTMTTRVDIPLFLLEANSRVSITTRTLCPDAAGRVEFTIRSAGAGRAGSGGTTVYDRNREAHVVAWVAENAEIASADIETKYSERSVADNRAVYVEAGTTAHVEGREYGGAQVTRHGVIRQSSQARSSDQHFLEEGYQESLVLGTMALEAARSHWQRGGCIRLKAEAPNLVDPGATTQIPVSVVHREEGGEIQARVEISLKGGESVDPELIPQSPGTLTHRAPDEREAQIVITLVATSRRGKSDIDLKIRIHEGQYTIEGGADEFHGSGLICDIQEPFEVEGSGVVVKFTPSSAAGGSYVYQGTMSGFPVWGNGNYTVQYDGEVAVGIVASGPGSVKTPMGVVSRAGTENYTLEKTRNGYCY